jgi:hypothetical protein
MRYRKWAKSDIYRYLQYFKRSLRRASFAIKDQLVVSYARSLILYFGNPLQAAGIWDRNAIESIERKVFRK